MHPVTPFQLLEADKENIQPIPQGRSASKLASLMKYDTDQLSLKLQEERATFENQLLPENLEEMDDPLQLYIQYVKWIRENYKTGNTKESQLIKVLERTTHDFKDVEYYKNDVRYFKMWLEYITYSENPGDIYNYLLKKQIGKELALFYENYALYFEAINQWDDADEILSLGLTNKARPIVRLKKSYDSFKIRKLNSINTQDQKSTLGLQNKDGIGLSSAGVSLKRKHSKIEIFQDKEPNTSSFNKEESTKFADTPAIDSLVNTNKENVINPSNWEGQTLKSTSATNQLNKKAKLQIFEDKSMEYPITKLVQRSDGKSFDTLDYNIDLFLSKDTSQLPNSLSEVLLMFFKPLEATNPSDVLSSVSVYDTPSQKRLKMDTDIEQDTPLVEYFKSSKQLFNSEDHIENGQTDLLDHLLPNKDEKLSLPNAIADGFSDIFQDTLTKTLEKMENQTENKQETNQVEPVTETTFSKRSNDEIMSSPFVENPNLVASLSQTVQPWTDDFFSHFGETVQNSLYNRSNYHNMSSTSFNKLPVLKNVLKSNLSPIYGNKQTLVEFESGSIYCFTKELHNSSQNISYLSERMDGEINTVIVSSPPNYWQPFIINRINEKLNDFIKCTAFYNFKDESYLLLPYFKQGSVSRLVNILGNHQSLTGKNLLEETIVIYFTIQLLNNMLKLHSNRFIHCSISPENCMLNIQTPNNKLTFNDVCFTDFSKSIDLSMLSQYTRFKLADEEHDWCFEKDYLGVANVIHTFLFGSELQTITTNEEVSFRETIKKYWQRDLWNELFKLLLNATDDMKQDLERIKSKFESWFSLTVDKRMFIARLNTIADILDSKKA
ncbi:hypothetical protein CANINC_000735 [Pichia inconspicua]|uniref:Protein kinase domain-containing protein n=1 Tax=Pichia inconspicua TaxID=52247 RepID=A0A4T0X5D3_9ASCO|nr:hypothetical protein CANINC_000735 [[Candida] inconspicua]